MNDYWRFYLVKHNRQDLAARTERFDPGKLATMPAGSLVLSNVGNRTDALVRTGTLEHLTTIPELNRNDFFVILRR